MIDPRVPQSLLNIDGDEISDLFDPAWQTAGISRVLLLAGVLAESGLNPHAERWGRYTTAARSAIRTLDYQWLQEIIDATWPDISFGYSQRIVKYHDEGDRSPTARNCLWVREKVFSDPGKDLQAMASRLRTCYDRTEGLDLSNIGHDRELGALIIYNAGHWPDPVTEVDWWKSWQGNVLSYKTTLDRIRRG